MNSETDSPEIVFPPKHHHMLDLSHLYDKNILNLLLNGVFGQQLPSDAVAKGLLVNFVRLADHTLVEYNLARSALTEYNDTPNTVLSPLFIAVGHFESCLTQLRRCRLFLIGIKKNETLPQMPRGLKILTKDAGKKIDAIRNGIQHLDEGILNGTIDKISHNALIISNEYVFQNGVFITYTELAEWVKEINYVAKSLSEHLNKAVPEKAEEPL